MGFIVVNQVCSFDSEIRRHRIDHVAVVIDHGKEAPARPTITSLNDVVSRVLAALLLLVSSVALAQYPARPIRMVVPFQAGSAPDVIARAISERLAAALGQPVVIDNKPGAGGNIGAEAAAKSPNDGYTLMLATISHASNPSLYRAVNYDPVKDFTAVSLLGRIPGLLVVPPDSPARTVADLIALAKAKPGTLNFASGGNGSQAHFAGEMFKQAAAIDVVHVPYKGAPEILWRPGPIS